MDFPFSAMQSSYVSLCNSSLYEKKQMADSSGNLPDGFQSAWRSYGAAGSDGLMHPYITLTLHAFVWHILLLFVGFFIGFSRHGDTSLSGFIKTLPILLICIGAATLLNVLFHSYGDINMFYISPYKITTQPVFSQIMKRTGIWIGNLLYITAMCITAFLIHRMFATIRRSCEK